MNKKFKSVSSLFITTAFIFSLTMGVMPSKVKALELNDDLGKKMYEQHVKTLQTVDLSKNLDEIIRVMVLMEEKPSVVNKTTTEANVISSQESVKLQARLLEGARIKYSFGYLINGFSMDVKRSELEKLEKMPGVKCVEESKSYVPNMTDAKKLTQAYNVWKDLKLKGEGVVVSVIDSGIDVSHKDMKLTDDTKAKLTLNDINYKIKRLGLPGKAYTMKIPYAYNYFDKNDDVIDRARSHRGFMHGMHVAGTVGANGNEEEVKRGEAIQGVAPECQLLGMKVFSNDEANESTKLDAVVAAIEDSVKLGADIINMSLGAAGGFQAYESNIEHEAVKNATDAGVLCVISAGNSAFSTKPYKIPGVCDTGIVGTPSVTEDSLSVASSENLIATNYGFEYSSDGEKGHVFYSVSGGHDPIVELKNPSGYDTVFCGLASTDEDFKGKDLNGKVALVQRGISSFDTKFLNVQKRGAVAVIVCNTKESGDALNFGMTFKTKEINIPAILVGYTNGCKMIEKSNKNMKIYFKGDYFSEENGNINDMSDFSSWGPAPNLEFKPEITSVGGQIWSTGNMGEGKGYINMSGTSMSSPHVAGAQALIFQSIINDPTLSFKSGREFVEFAKATAINTSIPLMDKHHPEVPYSPRRQGAGQIQIKNAIDNKVIVKGDDNKPTIALKQIGDEQVFNVTLKNYSNKDLTYAVDKVSELLTENNEYLEKTGFSTFPFDTVIKNSKLSLIRDDKEFKVDGSQLVTVPANNQVMLSFRILIPDEFESQQFVEGFLKFVPKDANAPLVGIPFFGFCGDWNKQQILDAPMWDEDNTLTGRACLIIDGKYTGGSVQVGNEVKVYKEKIAISPNGDGRSDIIFPGLVFLRNAREFTAEVVHKETNEVVKTFKTFKFVPKTETLVGETVRFVPINPFSWDGMIDKNNMAADGEYIFRMKPVIDFEGAKAQTYDMPFKVDRVKPTIKILSADKVSANEYMLKWQAEDDFSGIATNTVIVNKNIVDNAKIIKQGNVYSTKLTLDKGLNKVIVGVLDSASNMAMDNIDLEFNNLIDFKVKNKKITKTSADLTFECINSTTEVKKATLIVAAFDASGKLLNNAQSVCINIESGQTVELKGQIKELNPKAVKVKCFIWDSLEGMNPLTNVNEFDVPKK